MLKFSALHLLSTPRCAESGGVYFTSHEYVPVTLDPVGFVTGYAVVTENVVLFVVSSSDLAPPTSERSSKNFAVPLHETPSKSEISTLPPAARFPLSDSIFTVSCGFQLCFVSLSVGIC